MVEPRIEAGVRADDALRSAYATEYARLVGLARLLVDRREDAEEVVQEAFARTWARLGRVQGDPLPYLRRDPWPPIERIGHGHPRHTRQAGDVLHCRGHVPEVTRAVRLCSPAGPTAPG